MHSISIIVAIHLRYDNLLEWNHEYSTHFHMRFDGIAKIYKIISAESILLITYRPILHFSITPSTAAEIAHK